MPDCKKLRDPHLNVSAFPADGELARTLEIVGNEEPVDRLEGLRQVLDDLRACPASSASGRSRTLDLIAHANQIRLVQLGTSVIDPSQADIRQVFERMAADGLLKSLNISELRLLGCETAVSSEGQAAIRDLTEILGIRVVGTTKLVYSAYFGDKGLKDRYERMLRDATNLPALDELRAEWPRDPLPALAPPLELEMLKAHSVEELTPVAWPRLGRVDDTRPLLELIDGRDGRVMPRLLARPQSELLVSSGGDRVARMQILFDHELVRVQPADVAGSAIYRVRDPAELAAWVGSVGVG